MNFAKRLRQTAKQSGVNLSTKPFQKEEKFEIAREKMGEAGVPPEKDDRITKLLENEFIDSFDDDYNSADCRFEDPNTAKELWGKHLAENQRVT